MKYPSLLALGSAIAALFSLLMPLSACALEVHESFPPVVNPGESYVIYSHGLIVEGADATPVHPRFGVYDFPAVKAALFQGGGFNLIAPHRPKTADASAYVAQLQDWVGRLLEAGVPPGRITLVGFSRGAQLTAMAASNLRAAGVNTALLAVCVDGDYVAEPPVSLGGRVLSIFETSDSVGSCATLARRSELRSFEEIALSTGGGHGTFYRPKPEWLQPLKDWIARTQSANVATIPGSLRLSLESKLLGRHYDLFVKLPPGYHDPANAQRKYPVLYLNDGAWTFPVATSVTQLPMGASAAEGVILVGLGYAQELGSVSRIRDYTPTVDPTFENPTGEAEAYLDFLEREAIKAVEDRFRADPTRRAYAGHSFGGLFGAYVLFSRPRLFRYFILSSPSFWFHQHSMWGIERAYAAGNHDLQADVYLAIGSLERPGTARGSSYQMVGDVGKFERALLRRKYPGLRFRSFMIEGATHETAFPTAFLNGFLWHFAADRKTPYHY